MRTQSAGSQSLVPRVLYVTDLRPQRGGREEDSERRPDQAPGGARCLARCGGASLAGVSKRRGHKRRGQIYILHFSLTHPVSVV